MKRLVVIGGGFAGMMAALNAAGELDPDNGEFDVTLVSRDEFLVIRPRLYEQDAASLRASMLPAFAAAGVTFIEGEVTGIDTKGQTIAVARAGDEILTLDYDRLVVAAGSELSELPVPGAAEHAFNIDSYPAAVALDAHLARLVAAPDTPGRLTFVTVGGGMSGIELSLEMRNRLRAHGAGDQADAARIVLIERAETIGPEFGDDPRPVICEALDRARVERHLGRTPVKVTGDSIVLDDGTRIATQTVVIAVGLRANALGALIAAPRDEFGRLEVDSLLRVKGVRNVYAAGDIACARADDDHDALMSCQHARTMGKYAGYNAARDLLGEAPRPYRQADYTTCLDLGESGAVFTMGWQRKVRAAGAEAKKRKRWINSELIYPPTGDRAAVLAATRIDPQTGR